MKQSQKWKTQQQNLLKYIQFPPCQTPNPNSQSISPLVLIFPHFIGFPLNFLSLPARLDLSALVFFSPTPLSPFKPEEKKRPNFLTFQGFFKLELFWIQQYRIVGISSGFWVIRDIYVSGLLPFFGRGFILLFLFVFLEFGVR